MWPWSAGFMPMIPPSMPAQPPPTNPYPTQPNKMPRLNGKMRVLTTKRGAGYTYNPVLDPDSGAIFYQCAACDSDKLFKRPMDVKTHAKRCIKHTSGMVKGDSPSIVPSPTQESWLKGEDDVHSRPTQYLRRPPRSTTDVVPPRNPYTLKRSESVPSAARIPRYREEASRSTTQDYVLNFDESARDNGLKVEDKPLSDWHQPEASQRSTCDQRSTSDASGFASMSQYSQQPIEPSNADMTSQFWVNMVRSVCEVMSSQQAMSKQSSSIKGEIPLEESKQDCGTQKDLWSEPIITEFNPKAILETSTQCELIGEYKESKSTQCRMSVLSAKASASKKAKPKSANPKGPVTRAAKRRRENE